MRKLSSHKIEKIRFLRTQGHSLPEISHAVDVPKTTVFRYIRNVDILPEYISDWVGKRGGSKKKKLLKETAAFEEGKKIVGSLTYKEKALFLAALYWAEGTKKDFGLSNTDPELVKVYITGLRDIFGVQNDDLKVSVRIYEDLDKAQCLSFWSEVVGIPEEKFISVNVLPGKKSGKLQYGMCRIRVAKGGDLLKKVMGINKAVAFSMSS